MLEDYTATYYQEEERKLSMKNKQESASKAFELAQKSSDASIKHYIAFADKVVLISGATISASFTIYIGLQNGFPDNFIFNIVLFCFWVSFLIALIFGVLCRNLYGMYNFHLSNKFTAQGYKERDEAVLIVKDNIANITPEDITQIGKNVESYTKLMEKQEVLSNKLIGNFWRYYQTSLRSFVVGCCLIVVIISLLTILKDSHIPQALS